MPPSIKIEVHDLPANVWIPVGEFKLGDPDASISDNHSGGRDVYLFGIDPIENQGYIKRSELGMDIADPESREILSIGFITIAALNHSESYELTVSTDVSAVPRRVRFTYYED